MFMSNPEIERMKAQKIAETKGWLCLVWSYIWDGICFLPRKFYRAHMRSSIKEKQFAALPKNTGKSGCAHSFPHLDVVKYQLNCRCTKCGMKLKDAQIDVYGEAGGFTKTEGPGSAPAREE